MSTADETQALKMLEADTAEHVLEVLHDDGLYKHLRWRRPGTVLYRVDVVTWPGHLSIGGDSDTYVFAREPDMLDFFRAAHGRINPGYFAEKLRVPGHGDSVQNYSEDLFKREVRRAVEEWADGDEKVAAYVNADAALSYVDDSGDNSLAHLWLSTYRCVVSCPKCDATYQLDPDDPTQVNMDREVCNRGYGMPWCAKEKAYVREDPPRSSVFEFYDSWEWDLRDYDFHFLRACHAVLKVVAAYDAHRAAVAA